MSNKTQLQTNNASLDECIARVNAAKDVAAGLPEAGGGSVETCTVTINYNEVDFGGIGAIPESEIYCSILDNNGNIQTTHLQHFEFTENNWSYSASIVINNIVKNSILVIIDGGGTINEEIVQNGCETIICTPFSASPRAFFINKDSSIQI